MTGCPVDEAALHPARPSAARDGDGPPRAVPPLVDAAWLRDAPQPSPVVVLHVGSDAIGYYRGHVPGALPVDACDDLHDPLRRAPLGQSGFERLCERLGITRETHVVLYGGDGTPHHPAYAYWLFRYHRHPRLSLLDGGLPAWRDAGGAVTDTPVAVGPGSYRSPGPNPALRATRDDLLHRPFDGDEGRLLLDCRSPAEYAGQSRHVLDLPLEHVRATGHIPGARNLPAASVLTERATFRPVAELRELFAGCGVRSGTDVTLYCRTVERSSLLWFALHELLGHERSRRYDGGWAEYSSLMDVPVARVAPAGHA